MAGSLKRHCYNDVLYNRISRSAGIILNSVTDVRIGSSLLFHIMVKLEMAKLRCARAKYVNLAIVVSRVKVY
jgi:hypothetical protein